MEEIDCMFILLFIVSIDVFHRLERHSSVTKKEIATLLFVYV